MDLQTPLSHLTGIGPTMASRLTRLELFTVEDLINHYPFRYDDFATLNSALEAQLGQKVALKGEIWAINNIFTRSKKVLTQAIFNDGTTPITLTWFNSSWLTKQIQVGDKLQISGKLTKYKNKLSIIAPSWEKAKIPDRYTYSDPVSEDIKLIPIYPETYGVTSKWLRTKISQILPKVAEQIVDPLPDSIRDEMLPLTQALTQIHLPQSWQEAEAARVRLAFDELFYIQLATLKVRADWQLKPTTQALVVDQEKLNQFIKSLPFKLTSSQQKVIGEIIQDLKLTSPMNRLLQGEVGSGKTVVAAIAAYLAHLNGLKTLFMAPTEILAFQHFDTLKKLLEPHDLKVGIYTGSKKNLVTRVKSQGKTKTLDSRPSTLDSSPDIIVGTHALLSSKLNTPDVGLVIVDEQQRFGVEQRTLLRSRAKVPHFLTMTATPIPRTVALTLYGDLDLSHLDELPQGRPEIKTFLVPERKRLDSYKFIEKKVREGDQVYVITPLIEPSETLQTVKAALVEFEKLKKVFPNLTLGLLHGRLKSAEKEQVISKFRDGKIDILVSTSVVEVGMDIPNATIMVIEGAERFGLAQLHQLRGRVGRGSKISYCLLYTSDSSSAHRQRLKHLETTFDGMKLAELDLKIRGSGELFGTRQSGRFELKLASFSDLTLIEKTRETAREILNDDPQLDKYPKLQAQLSKLASNVMPD